jgi:acetyl esterase/lipase
MLQHYADHSSLTVVSVGYRLAPEHPYPAGNEDCVDIAEHLVAHGKEEFGGPLLFMGGDSAGAHLSVLTCFRLLQTRPQFAFRGLVLNFGMYDLAGRLPQVYHFDLPLILDGTIITRYISSPDSRLWFAQICLAY